MAKRRFLRPEVEATLKSDESMAKVANFVASDIFIASPPKCSTTWMQQIVHQLRSGGDMNFNNIDDAVLFVDVTYDIGKNLDDEQNYQPRCFRTHLIYEHCPKGEKYILVYREPCAAIYSAYRFLEGMVFEPGELTIEDFIECFYMGTRPFDYFKHLLTWWPKQKDHSILILTYEDMLEDLESAVRSVAAFIGIEDEERINNALKMSSFDFMKRNQEKFSSGAMYRRFQESGLLTTERGSPSRVVTGSATKGREMLSDGAKQAIQNRWNETITSTLGFQNYETFRTALKK